MVNKRISTLIYKVLMIVCCIPALGAIVLLVMQAIMLIGAAGRVTLEAWLMFLTEACTAAGTVCSLLRVFNRPWKLWLQLLLALGSLGFGMWLWSQASENLNHSFCRMIALPGVVQGMLHLIWSALNPHRPVPRPIKRLNVITPLSCTAVSILGPIPLLAALIFLPYKFMAETDWSQEWPMLALVTGNVLTVLALTWLLRDKKGWLWGFAGLLAGHVFLCWRLYEMTYFMSDGGAVASLVLWAGLLQGAVVAVNWLVKHFRKGDSL